MQSVQWLLTVIVVAAFPAMMAAQSPNRGPVSPPLSDTLRPGDLVRLKIWREPDLSGDFAVSETGEAVFPKLGAILVTHISVDSLRRFVRTSYETYLRNPAIEVTVLRRVNVAGAVKNPGLYSVDPTMTVADAVLLAGGATADGRIDRLELIRDGHRLNIALEPGSRLSDTPLSSGDQLFVPLRSWLSRNASWLITGTAGLAGVIIAIAAQ